MGRSPNSNWSVRALPDSQADLPSLPLSSASHQAHSPATVTCRLQSVASGACFHLDPTFFQKDCPQQWQEEARTKGACWFCPWGEEAARVCLSSVPETHLALHGLVCGVTLPGWPVNRWKFIICVTCSICSQLGKGEPVSRQWQEATGSCQSPHAHSGCTRPALLGRPAHSPGCPQACQGTFCLSTLPARTAGVMCIPLVPEGELFAHPVGEHNGYSSEPPVLWPCTMLIP